MILLKRLGAQVGAYYSASAPRYPTGRR